MGQPWYICLGWWLCEKTGHIGQKAGWVYKGHYHCECRWCGRIISKPLKEAAHGITGEDK